MQTPKLGAMTPGMSTPLGLGTPFGYAMTPEKL